MNKIIFILFILIFLFTEMSALCEEGQIDINSASLEELDKIKWIGNSTASKIIEYRQDNQFDNIDELINISGIGETKLEDIKAEGLACVEKEQSEEIEKENSIEEEEIEEVNEPEITESDTQENTKITAKEVETIKLIPKDIKSGIDKEELNKERLATYGLGIFCILLTSLFVIKIRKDKKNEFK